MSTYHKIIINSQTFFRAFDESTGFYEDEMLTEKELIERLLEDAVRSTIENDQQAI